MGKSVSIEGQRGKCRDAPYFFPFLVETAPLNSGLLAFKSSNSLNSFSISSREACFLAKPSISAFKCWSTYTFRGKLPMLPLNIAKLFSFSPSSSSCLSLAIFLPNWLMDLSIFDNAYDITSVFIAMHYAKIK